LLLSSFIVVKGAPALFNLVAQMRCIVGYIDPLWCKAAAVAAAAEGWAAVAWAAEIGGLRHFRFCGTLTALSDTNRIRRIKGKGLTDAGDLYHNLAMDH